MLLNATTQLLPLLNQLNPAVDELADGTRDFTPTPQESRNIISDNYSVPGTLLVRSLNPSDESVCVSAPAPSLAQVPICTEPGFRQSTAMYMVRVRFWLPEVLGDTLRASDGDALGASDGDMLGAPARAMWEGDGEGDAFRVAAGLLSLTGRCGATRHRFGSRTTPSTSRRRWRRF